MDAGIAALLGALIGGITSWLATWSIEVRRDRRQGRSLAIAAASEIDAILLMLDARKWRASFEAAHHSALAGHVYNVEIHARDEYFPMCRAALTHAGVINRDLSVLLSRLLILGESLTADMKRLSEHPIGTPGSLLETDSPEFAAKVYAELLQIIDAGFHVGSEIVTMVDRMYPKSVGGFWGRVKAAGNIILSGT